MGMRALDLADLEDLRLVHQALTATARPEPVPAPCPQPYDPSTCYVWGGECRSCATGNDPDREYDLGGEG